jgi:cell cycle sensor histidine kinase DivJ
LSRLLNDLVDLAKVESQGAAVLKMEPDDLAAIAREAISVFGSANKTANLAADLQADLPQVECDREKVGRMLAHLLENALQFSPPDSLIRVSTSINRAGTQVGLAVEDHGSGIAAADLPRMGEKFFRSETATLPGNGLGLALVKAVIQAHGGTLKIDSVPGDATVMTLWFPLTRRGERSQ